MPARRLRAVASSAYGIVALIVLFTVGGTLFVAVALLGAMLLGLLYALTAPSRPQPRLMRRERRSR